MSENKFEEFRDLVLADESLQEELRALTSRHEFLARLIKLGSERGYEFTLADLEAEMRKSRRISIER